MEYRNTFARENHYLRISCGTKEKTWEPLEHQLLAQAALGANKDDIITQYDDVIQVSMNPDYNESIGGFLVLPTGAGKTSTTVNWLVNNIFVRNKGYKVLWIAHQNLLLEQAAESFYKHISQAESNKILSVRVVSGDHDNILNIRNDDDVIIISRQTLGGNIDSLLEKYQRNQKIYLIIDEAHHASANTYVNIVNEMITENFLVKLIGLTATPTRTKESEIYDLRKVFSIGELENINPQGTRLPLIYNQDIQVLFIKKILALPHLMTEKIPSHLSLAMNFTKRQWDELARRHNFNIDQIDDRVNDIISERSKLILDLYKKNREDFGKTLIFAWNQNNAIELTEIFRNDGIRVDYVISDRNNNQEVIDRFKNNELDVLINVNILSEGSDVPNIKTVFLTRYTKSRILMTQMIGRALRGPRVGGTETANIISFVDEKLFSKLKDLINPEDIIQEMQAPPEVETGRNNLEQSSNEERELNRILNLLEKLLFSGNQYKETYLSSLSIERRYPVGFYDISFGDGKYPLLVFDNQKQAYESLEEQLRNHEQYLLGPQRGIFLGEEISEALIELTQNLVSHLYEIMEPPYIDIIDIEKFMKHFIEIKQIPKFIPIPAPEENSFAGLFKNIDSKVAELLNENKTENEIIKIIVSLFNSYIENLENEDKKKKVVENIEMEIRNSINRNSQNQELVIKELTNYNPIRINTFNEIPNDYEYAVVLYISNEAEEVIRFFNSITNKIKKDDTINKGKCSFLIIDTSSQYTNRDSYFYRKKEEPLPNIIVFNEYGRKLESIFLRNQSLTPDFQESIISTIRSYF